MAKNGRKKKTGTTKLSETKQQIRTIYDEPQFRYLNDHQEEFGKKIRDSQITLCSGPAGTGKAQPLNSKILTSSGYTTMGAIKKGDLILGDDGKEYNVLQTHPQGEKDVYKIKFSDGSVTECTEDHMWFTRTDHDRNFRKKVNSKKIKAPKSGSTKTLKQVKDTLYTRRGRKNHSIPLTDKVQFVNKDVSIPPYTLGALLGDGCLIHNPTITTNDELIINIISEELKNINKNTSVTKHRHKNKHSIKVNDTKENWVTSELNELGLLNTKSDNKFIPNLYKINSTQKRKELLKGLLDTDGYINKRNGGVFYYTISKNLAEDVGFIVNSLGGHYIISEKNGKYKNESNQTIECSKCYTLKITLPDDDYFKLDRKQNLIENKNRRNIPARFIESIEYIGKKEVKCITTSNPSGLYITDDFIVTHNSYLGFLEALKLLHEGNNNYEKIIIITPAVESEEKLGSLPGELNEKLEPFIYSSFYLIDDIIGKQQRLNLRENNILQVLALAYLRGVNIDNAILIFEEAQNSTVTQMKTLLSRIGKNSKFIVSGDIKQIDRFKRSDSSGLIDAINRLHDVNDIEHVDLSNADIVRNPLIEEILTKYEN